MKKIISAWIEQVIEFDSMTEYQKFINDLKNGKRLTGSSHPVVR